MGFPGSSDDKKSACNAGDLSSIPGLGRPPGGGHGNPLQYSCLENPHGQRSLQATAHGVTKGQTRLSDYHTHKPAYSYPDFVGLFQTHILVNASLLEKPGTRHTLSVLSHVLSCREENAR